MKKLGTYDCENPKGCWKAGYYNIDFENEKQKKIAIWDGLQWAVANIPSAKQAIKILQEEFESVKKLED